MMLDLLTNEKPINPRLMLFSSQQSGIEAVYLSCKLDLGHDNLAAFRLNRQVPRHLCEPLKG